MRNQTLLAACAVSLIVGFAANNFVMSDVPANFKVAKVDVQKVVTSSKMVNALKDERKNKVDELVKFAEKGRAEVAKESDPAKKKSIEEKYNKELNAKKEAIDKEYVTKLENIDKSISGQIEKKAKDSGYDLVLSKGIVLYGATDITDEISKIIK